MSAKQGGFWCETMTVFLPGGAQTQVTVVQVPSGSADFRLVYDRRLFTPGIVTDAGGILIDQAATAVRIGGPAGVYPEEWLQEAPEGSILASTLGHAGWQRLAGLIDRGKIVAQPGEAGQLDQLDWCMPTADLGYTAPRVVQGGKLVPLMVILKDPRVRADARNLFAFNGTEQVPADFFQLIRPYLPTTAEELGTLLLGGSVEIARPSVPGDSTFAQLEAVILGCNLRHLELDRYDGHDCLFIRGAGLSRQRMPLMGSGFTDDDTFVVVAVDGRQPGSAGCTIEELGGILREAGVVSGYLGGGGGDVYIGQKTEAGVIARNTPSNRFEDGRFGASRRIPNALIITPR